MADLHMREDLGAAYQMLLSTMDVPEDVSIYDLEVHGSNKELFIEPKQYEQILSEAQAGRPVIMFSVAGAYIANNTQFQALMGLPNVSYFDAISSLRESLPKAVAEAVNQTRPKDELAIEANKLGLGHTADAIGALKHNLYHVQSGNQTETYRADWEKKARQVFGDLPFDELVAKTDEATRETMPAYFEGRQLPGTFSDVQGTLVQDGQINQDLLAELQERAKTEPITVWTDGDITEAQRVLRPAGILWKVLPKAAFRGAKAQDVYDDLSEDEFKTQYEIEPESYHQVKPQENLREGVPGPTRI